MRERRIRTFYCGEGIVCILVACLLFSPASTCIAFAQALPGAAPTDGLKPNPPGREAVPELPAAQVAVKPEVTDEQISTRLRKILEATPDWFYEPNVEVRDGVAFLRGQTKTTERKAWAGELARSTEGVVAVVNLIDVSESPLWDFRPALNGIYDLWRTSLQRLPWLVFGLAVMIVAYLGARLTQSVLLILFKHRIGSQLLRGIAAWLGGAVVFLGGLYVVLYVAGLTGLVLTVLGGTGLIGLVLGIGFRDITENFLSSIFLSVQIPFRNGDMVELNGVTGIVQRMTNRATLLMTFEGNHVQIPNAVVYKSTIINYTSNPNRREDFTVNISYDASIEKAQEVAQGVLREHPAVLQDPEPMVLAVALAPGSVTLRIFFWVNVHDHDRMKVKSAVIRLVKHRFDEEKIAVPDGTREVVFARDVSVRLVESNGKRAEPAPAAPKPAARKAAPDEQIATSSEGGLASEADSLKQQAQRSRPPEGGADLLKPAPTETPAAENQK